MAITGILDRRNAQRVARGLGLFSLALGVPQAAAPGGFVRAIGAPDGARSRLLARLVGLRELGAAAGIFAQRRPTPWLWARVAGDAMDLVLLAAAMGAHGARRGRLALSLAGVAGVAAVDLADALRLSRDGRESGKDHGMHVKKSVTVWRSPDEVYRYWRNFENLPRFMGHLQTVRVLDDRRSHWVTEAPGGRSVEWDAEIVDDRPGELIAWRSVAGADVPNSGEVRFAPSPDGKGTEVHVEMRYDPPGGKVGKTVAKLLGKDAGQQVGGDLKRFKQVLETGEVIRSDATVASNYLPQRPAQPPERVEQPALAA